jgi:hypothetical protein
MPKAITPMIGAKSRQNIEYATFSARPCIPE